MRFIRSWRAMIFSLILTGSVLASPGTQARAAVAPSCTADRPTSLGGALYGYGGQFNNWTINALVGIDLIDANGNRVNPDGSPHPANGYPALDFVNPNLAQPGMAGGGERTWGSNSGDGPLCVSSSVKTVFLETYPKSPGGTTDKTYFGGSQHHGWVVSPGVANSYTLRLLTNDEYGGNTGGVNGYITQGGHKVNVGTTAGTKSVTIRAWSHEGSCGVFGFSASADVFGPSGSLDADYYRVDHLAGGQCRAATQTYDLHVSICTWVTQSNGTLACTGSTTQVRAVNITDGDVLGAVNFSF